MLLFLELLNFLQYFVNRGTDIFIDCRSLSVVNMCSACTLRFILFVPYNRFKFIRYGRNFANIVISLGYCKTNPIWDNLNTLVRMGAFATLGVLAMLAI